jgi:SET domain-containing protein
MDAASTQTGLARYANDCRSANKRAGQCKGNNSKFDMTTTRAGKTTIWLRATKNIKAGSEILISYGRKYWGD